GGVQLQNNSTLIFDQTGISAGTFNQSIGSSFSSGTIEAQNTTAATTSALTLHGSVNSTGGVVVNASAGTVDLIISGSESSTNAGVTSNHGGTVEVASGGVLHSSAGDGVDGNGNVTVDTG